MSDFYNNVVFFVFYLLCILTRRTTIYSKGKYFNLCTLGLCWSCAFSCCYRNKDVANLQCFENKSFFTHIQWGVFRVWCLKFPKLPGMLGTLQPHGLSENLL